MATKPNTAAVTIDGHKLRQLRKQTGVEVVELAAAIGIDRANLTRIELGQASRVRPKTFRAICEYFGVPRDDRWQLMVDGQPWQSVSGSGEAQAVA